MALTAGPTGPTGGAGPALVRPLPPTGQPVRRAADGAPLAGIRDPSTAVYTTRHAEVVRHAATTRVGYTPSGRHDVAAACDPYARTLRPGSLRPAGETATERRCRATGCQRLWDAIDMLTPETATPATPAIPNIPAIPGHTVQEERQP